MLYLLVCTVEVMKATKEHLVEAAAALVIATVQGDHVLARAQRDQAAFRRATQAAKSVLDRLRA